MARVHEMTLVGAVVIAALGCTPQAQAQGSVVPVADVEELYAAVNDPANAGATVVLAPGTYVLTALDPGGAARPVAGRLELQRDMSLLGTIGDRDAVVIDGASLPQSSYVTQVSAGLPPSNTAAIRIGRGTNTIEWLTARGAVRGIGAISTDLIGTGPTRVRVAHVAAIHSNRGIDVRNFGPSAAGRSLDAQLVDNHVFGNTAAVGEAFRIANLQGATGARIVARLRGNRVYGNDTGMIVANNRSSGAAVAVSSAGDRFVANGVGVLLVGGLSSNAIVANGNTVTFEAQGSDFSDNEGETDFDRGGLVIVGGENISIPYGASGNSVNVTLRGCRLEGNQLRDLGAIGARSVPATLGAPGTHNRVVVRLAGGHAPAVVETADSIPEDPSWMNGVVVER
jgi:hypothetical protein